MLNIFTIVLDGMPFIERHLEIFERLPIQWSWTIVEGSAMSVGCTSWTKGQLPGLSRDGTTQYLSSIARLPNVVVIQKEEWAGKLAMINAAVQTFVEPGILMEIDVDEFWSPRQLCQIANLFEEHPYAGAMQFDCRYFVGPDIITQGIDCYGCHTDYEWRRAWRFLPGQFFLRHEPPEFPHPGVTLMNDVTRSFGLVFDHFAWATIQQVRYKQEYYGYAGAVEGWERLQKNTVWPIHLKKFLPWVDDKVMVVKV